MQTLYLYCLKKPYSLLWHFLVFFFAFAKKLLFVVDERLKWQLYYIILKGITLHTKKAKAKILLTYYIMFEALKAQFNTYSTVLKKQ